MRITEDFLVDDKYYWKIFRKISKQWDKIKTKATSKISYFNVAMDLNPRVDSRIILDCVCSIALSNSITRGF